MKPEGWYVDPYGLHEARWFSDGAPTALVRDGDLESKDPPPDTPPVGPLESLAETGLPDGSDLRRADSAETTSFGAGGDEEVWDGFAESSGGD